MNPGIISAIAFLLSGFSSQEDFLLTPIPQSELVKYQILGVVDKKENVLAQNTLDLTNREADREANSIFVDNILLNLHYWRGDIKNLVREGEETTEVLWEELRKPFEFSFVLSPKMVFAFHDNLLPEYKKELVATVGNQFSAQEGYRKAYGIYGNGVCHLASLMNWTASEAGLEVIAKKDHDFSPVPGVPLRYGTLISYSQTQESKEKNLYIKNNFDFPVVFQFKVNEEKLELAISKLQ